MSKDAFKRALAELQISIDLAGDLMERVDLDGDGERES
jgi:hypothetical protein